MLRAANFDAIIGSYVAMRRKKTEKSSRRSVVKREAQ